MKQYDTVVLYQPDSEELRFLPEGPYRCPDGRVSWVAIQHGKNSREGSLNLLDPRSGRNENYPLAGRPGFAFPTIRDGQFVVGMERSVGLVDLRGGDIRYLCEGIDRNVDGTIINDGVLFDGHLVFGCKDLDFTEHKAGLYLLRSGETDPVLLSGTQVCSNGKAVMIDDHGAVKLLDICSCSKQVMEYRLDLESGRLLNPRVAVDLTQEPFFPDGMILTPDQRSVIVAIYDPRDVDHGRALQYEIESGQLQASWICPYSPRVTCPQLIELDGRVELLLTTADEGMSPELRARCFHAGCIFVGPTEFKSCNDNPLFPMS